MKEPALGAPPGDLRRLLEEAGAAVSESRGIQHGAQYRITRGAETVIVNVFDKGTVQIQGKDSALRTLLEGWKLGRAPSGAPGKESKSGKPGGTGEPDPTPRTGADEAGKGDYFGPLVVAGTRVRGEEADRALRDLGVRDSKLLAPGQAVSIAEEIHRKLGPENLYVVCLAPPEFERRRSGVGENVNRLLGELNVEIVSEIGGGVERFVVDEFAKKARSYIEPGVPAGVDLEVRPRAEDDTAVAAASILARARYLREMQGLSEWAGFTLPRGATHVKEAARRLLVERGREGLERAAKVSFSTTASLAGAGGRVEP